MIETVVFLGVCGLCAMFGGKKSESSTSFENNEIWAHGDDSNDGSSDHSNDCGGNDMP